MRSPIAVSEYRTRVKLAVSRAGAIGLYAEGHEVVDLPGCVVATPSMRRTLDHVRAALLDRKNVEIARAMRGQLPRAGDSLVVLLLARQGAPLSDDEMDLLGRAGGGGGDLDALRQTQAAWLYLKRKSGTPAQAISIIQGGAPAQAPAPSGGSAPASNPAPTSNPAAPGGPAPAGTPAPAGNSGASAPPKRTP